MCTPNTIRSRLAAPSRKGRRLTSDMRCCAIICIAVIASAIARPTCAVEKLTPAQAVAQVKENGGEFSNFIAAPTASHRRQPGDSQPNVRQPGANQEKLPTRVDLVGKRITDAHLALLKYIPTIETVYVHECPVGDAGIKELKALPHLATFGFYGKRTGPTITDEGLCELCEAKTLKKLYLHRGSVGARGFQCIATLQHLEVLMAAGPSINDAALSNLRRSPTIARLSLSKTTVTDEGLRALKDLAGLKGLVIEGCCVTDQGLDCVTDFPALEAFTIRSDALSDRALEHLKGFHQLTGLGIGGAAITDAALTHLSDFPHLTGLDLSYNPQITDAGLKYLSPLKKLQFLALHNTGTTDNGLLALTALPDLRFVNLSFTGVTDAGLQTLKRIRSLRQLILTATRVSDEAAQKFSEETGVSIPGK